MPCQNSHLCCCTWYSYLWCAEDFHKIFKSGSDEIRRTNTNFVEVYVNATLEVCEAPHVKGLYPRARKGEIPNFTGISDLQQTHISVLEITHLKELAEALLDFKNISELDSWLEQF